MKTLHLLTVSILLLAGQRSDANVLSFDDIVIWAGSGSNEAALVVDWNDGQSPLAWGYRWDGAATGEDLFRAVVAEDDSLFARIQVFGFGSLLNGVGYDRDEDGFEVAGASGTKSFDADGLFEGAETEFGTTTDVDDSYAEANNTTFEFWEYFNGVGNPYAGGSWTSGTSGFSGRLLSDGDWDGWFYPGTFGGDPLAIPGLAIAAGATTAAVPEPSTVFLLAFAALALMFRQCSQKMASRKTTTANTSAARC